MDFVLRLCFLAQVVQMHRRPNPRHRFSDDQDLVQNGKILSAGWAEAGRPARRSSVAWVGRSPCALKEWPVVFCSPHGEDLSKGFGMTKFKLVTRKWQVIQRFADFRHAGGEKAGAGWGTLREPWPPCRLPDRFAKDGLC